MYWPAIPILKCFSIVALKNYIEPFGSNNKKSNIGLIILEPHISNILNGKKTIDLRKMDHKKHIGKRIALLQGGFIHGYADFIGTKEYQNKKELLSQQKKHRASSWMNQNDDFSYRYGYIFDNIEILNPPKPYQHPQGAQTWVKL